MASFGKNKRLCKTSEIEFLFSKKKSFPVGMMRVLYTENPFEEKETLKLLISVPKKNIPLAVNRNRIKRLIREAYRHHYETLEQLLKGQNKHFLLAFIFFGKEVPSSSDVQFWVAKAMAELKSNLK